MDCDEMSEAEEEGFRRMLESFLRGDNPTWSPRSEEEEEECCCAIQWQDDVPLWDESGSEAGAASNGPEASASPASPATPPANPANDVLLNPEAPLDLTIHATPPATPASDAIPRNLEAPLDLTIKPLDLRLK